MEEPVSDSSCIEEGSAEPGEGRFTIEAISGGVMCDSVSCVWVAGGDEDIDFRAGGLGRECGKMGGEFRGIVGAGKVEEVVDIVFREGGGGHG